MKIKLIIFLGLIGIVMICYFGRQGKTSNAPINHAETSRNVKFKLTDNDLNLLVTKGATLEQLTKLYGPPIDISDVSYNGVTKNAMFDLTLKYPEFLPNTPGRIGFTADFINDRMVKWYEIWREVP